jgi:hypothetical protein
MIWLLTKRYRMLIIYDSEYQIFIQNRIRKKMMLHGISNIDIHESPPTGNKFTLEVYYDSDIPISQRIAVDIFSSDMNIVVKVIQEVKDNKDNWVNVDKHFQSYASQKMRKSYRNDCNSSG